ncbi:MAG TPA: ZIP family metal transporter [archaeon]|nr:ZIP family metal transporter [archaeon]
MLYLLFALGAGIATLIGGLLHNYTRLKDIRIRYAIGFSSGILISTAIFEMLPEMRPDSFDTVALALGFFSFYLVEKGLTLHACKEKVCRPKSTSLGIVGITLDNVVDGAAIAAGFFINPIVGLTIALAVALHEIPQGFSTSVIMKNSRLGKKWIFSVLIAAAIMTPIGAYLSLHLTQQFFGHILAFSAGTFLYVGASDLLPEAHKTIDRKIMVAVLAGAIIIPAIGLVLAH